MSLWVVLEGIWIRSETVNIAGYQMRLLVWRVVKKTLKFCLTFLILLTINFLLTATFQKTPLCCLWRIVESHHLAVKKLGFISLSQVTHLELLNFPFLFFSFFFFFSHLSVVVCTLSLCCQVQVRHLRHFSNSLLRVGLLFLTIKLPWVRLLMSPLWPAIKVARLDFFRGIPPKFEE